MQSNSKGDASPEKVGWERDRVDGQRAYLTILISFLLRNEYRPVESGPGPPRGAAAELHYVLTNSLCNTVFARSLI